jgi:hypothetical protein
VQQITGCDVVHIEAGKKHEPHYGPPPAKREVSPFTLRAPKSH